MIDLKWHQIRVGVDEPPPAARRFLSSWNKGDVLETRMPEACCVYCGAPLGHVPEYMTFDGSVAHGACYADYRRRKP